MRNIITNTCYYLISCSELFIMIPGYNSSCLGLYRKTFSIFLSCLFDKSHKHQFALFGPAAQTELENGESDCDHTAQINLKHSFEINRHFPDSSFKTHFFRTSIRNMAALVSSVFLSLFNGKLNGAGTKERKRKESHFHFKDVLFSSRRVYLSSSSHLKVNNNPSFLAQKHTCRSNLHAGSCITLVLIAGAILSKCHV